MSSLQSQLAEGVAQMGLEALTAQQLSALERYVFLLEQWGKVFNLTATANQSDMISRHVLDSLSILPYLQGARILDVGSGAGLPGIPLAVALGTKSFVLVESREKRIHFLNTVIRSLQLSNVSVLPNRVEKCSDTEGFHTIMARAFAPLDRFVAMTTHLLAPDGVWCAMTGADVQVSAETLGPDYQVVEQTALAVPGQDKRRQIVVVKKSK